MEQEPIQTIKQIKKSNKCAYPGCKKISMMQIMLPVGSLTESGQIEFPQEGKNQSIQSSCPLCDYHFAFSNKGLLNLIDQNGMIRLVGPFPIIEIVESVLEAREFQKVMNKQKNANKKAK